MAGAHERGIQRHQNKRILFFGFDQFPNGLEERFVEVELGEREL